MAVRWQPGVVVVSFNYRLGIFDFSPSRSRSGSPIGQLWLQDQLAALRWVKANIADSAVIRATSPVRESAGACPLAF